MTSSNKSLELPPKEEIVREAAARGFPEYCLAIDPSYDLEWFHKQIALRLEKAVKQVENGEDVRLMIFMPPRHGKSDAATQKFPSWTLGKHPDWPFIVASYSSELATDFGQGTRDLMDVQNYRFIFDTRLREDTTAKAKWMTQEGGGYTAVGVGGAITGRGFKVGIIDDPFKNREEADSPVTRESIHKWYRSTFYTRQEGNTAIILILTRWHDDDLAGRLLKEQKEAELNGEEDYDKWEVLEFKALAEQDEPFRKKGEALWPTKFNLAKLQRTRASLGSYEWSALYQQNPIDEESQEFKKEWLQYRSFEEVEAMSTRKFATIDPAGSKNKDSDFTGVTRNWVNDLNEWHLKSQRYRLNSQGVINLIFKLHLEGFEKIGIEEGVYKDAIEPFLRVQSQEKGLYPNVVTLKHRGIMKETRIRGLIPRYESRKVYHLRGFVEDLEEEYLRFPKGAHDDCLDSLAYQNQIAQTPSAGEGDSVSLADIQRAVTSKVNRRQGNTIVAISSQLPVSVVIGNNDGVFFNNVFQDQEEPFKEIGKYLKEFENVYVLSDTPQDFAAIDYLKTTNNGRLFIAYLSSDLSMQSICQWGKKNEYGDVEVFKDQAFQTVITELKSSRMLLNGNVEDWQPLLEQIAAFYRVWEVDANGNRSFRWESQAPQGLLKALLYFRAGLEKFGSSMEFAGPGFFEGLPREGDPMQW